MREREMDEVLEVDKIGEKPQQTIESDNDIRKKGDRIIVVAHGIAALFFLLSVYIFSFGPVLYLVEKMESGILFTIVAYVYYPLFILMNSHTYLGDLLEAYVYLFVDFRSWFDPI